MNRTARPFYNPDNVDTIDDVLTSLELLEHDLALEDLEKIKNFNYTYLVITRNVRAELRKGSFEHPEFLRRFDTRFAYYYFRALQAYLQGKPTARAWKLAFDSAKRPGTSSLLGMALGVNAHVNNDIPLVLIDCQAAEKHWRDYSYVNAVIARSIDEVIDHLADDSGIMGPKRILRPLYKPIMSVMVRLWRYRAWRNYRKLDSRQLSNKRLEHRAVRLGRYLNRLPV